jgi:hypothetical protein
MRQRAILVGTVVAWLLMATACGGTGASEHATGNPGIEASAEVDVTSALDAVEVPIASDDAVEVGDESDAGPWPPVGAGNYAAPPPESICTPDGWCWQSPSLPWLTFEAVAGSSVHDFWAVSEAGQALHVTGDARPWRLHRAADTTLLAAVSFGADDTWAVGEGGVVVHWDGSDWAPVASPGASTLRTLGGAGPDDLWTAVDEIHTRDEWTSERFARFVHWDGGAWTPEARAFQDVSVTSIRTDPAGTSWAVGDRTVWSGCTEPPLRSGVLLRFDGTMWDVAASVDGASFSDVWVNRADDVWLAGAEQLASDEAFEPIFGATVFRFDGLAVTPALRREGYAFVGLAADAAGLLDAVTSEGRVVHDVAGQPVDTSFAGDLTRLVSLGRLGDGTTVATGILGGLYLEGPTGWTGLQDPMTPPYPGDLLALSGSSAHDLWAVGGLASTWMASHATALHGVDGAWLGTSFPLVAVWHDVAALAPDDAWVVGTEGTEFEGPGAAAHWDGEAWTPFVVPFDQGLLRVAAGDAADAWALGNSHSLDGYPDGASVLHFDGATWTVDAVLGDVQLSAVGVTRDGQVWLAGYVFETGATVFFRRTGAMWGRVDGGLAGVLFDLVPAGEGGLLGAGGSCTGDNVCRPFVATYDRETWAAAPPIPDTSARMAYTAWARAPDDAFVVTDAGTYRLRRGAWAPFDPQNPLSASGLIGFGDELWVLTGSAQLHRTLTAGER